MKLPVIAYLYDEETGVYLNQCAEAVEDAKQKNTFSIPINATLQVPPSVVDPHRQVAVFKDDEWHIERKGGVPMDGPLVRMKRATQKVTISPEQEAGRG